MALRVYEESAALWAWTSQPRPSWRESGKEAAVLLVVFSVSGSSSMAIARIAVGTKASCSLTLVAVSIVYYPVLVMFGTVAGRHAFIVKLLQRLGRSSSGRQGQSRWALEHYWQSAREV
uniref:Uncharacterized protein n=1 Tax=Haptolina brevifila TaxID=156173 RepID=A0A7S2NN99_9EUKA